MLTRSLVYKCVARCVGLALVSAAKLAAAQPNPSAMQVNGTQSPPQVDIVVIQDEDDIDALQSKTLSWFGGSMTRVKTRQEARLDAAVVLSPSPVAGVRVWIVRSSATTVWLYFVVQVERGSIPRYLVRELRLDNGLDELGLEQVAQVVYLSSQALWTGQIQSTRRQFEDRLALVGPVSSGSLGGRGSRSPANPTHSMNDEAKSEPHRSSWLVQSEIGYSLRLLGHEGIAQGPLVALRVVHAPNDTQIGGRLVAQLLLPHQQRSGPVQLDLRGYSLRATFWTSGSETAGLSPTAEIGPGIDWVRYSASAIVEQGLKPVGAQWEVRPILWLALGMQGGHAPVRFGLQTSIALQLLDTHYDLADGSQRTRLLTAWLFQPGFSAQAIF